MWEDLSPLHCRVGLGAGVGGQCPVPLHPRSMASACGPPTAPSWAAAGPGLCGTTSKAGVSGVDQHVAMQGAAAQAVSVKGKWQWQPTLGSPGMKKKKSHQPTMQPNPPPPARPRRRGSQRAWPHKDVPRASCGSGRPPVVARSWAPDRDPPLLRTQAGIRSFLRWAVIWKHFRLYLQLAVLPAHRPSPPASSSASGRQPRFPSVRAGRAAPASRSESEGVAIARC